MDTPRELWRMITGNMALIQVSTGTGRAAQCPQRPSPRAEPKAPAQLTSPEALPVRSPAERGGTVPCQNCLPVQWGWQCQAGRMRSRWPAGHSACAGPAWPRPVSAVPGPGFLCAWRGSQEGLLWPVQVQATVVGFLASIAAVIFGWIPDGHFSIPHAFLLCASSVATAFIASLVLGKEGQGLRRGCLR